MKRKVKRSESCRRKEAEAVAEPIQYPYFAPGIRYGVFAAGRVEDGTKEGDIAADWFLLPAEPEDLARDLDAVFAKKNSIPRIMDYLVLPGESHRWIAQAIRRHPGDVLAINREILEELGYRKDLSGETVSESDTENRE